MIQARLKLALRVNSVRGGAIRWTVGAALLLVALSPLALAQGVRRALLIGIDDYKAPIPKLTGAENDVLAIADALIQHVGFKKENVRVLVTRNPSPVLKPTKLNILKELQELEDTCGPEDFVIVYFSGHGFKSPVGSCLVPSNLNYNDIPEMMEGDAITGIQLKLRLATIKCKVLLAVFDMCRNAGDQVSAGSSSKSLPSPSTKDLQIAPPSVEAPLKAEQVITMMSCTDGDVSWEDRVQKRSVFSLYFEKALRGEGGEELWEANGELRLGKVFDWVYDRVIQATTAEPYRKTQTPVWLKPAVEYNDQPARRLVLATGLTAEQRAEQRRKEAEAKAAEEAAKKQAEEEARKEKERKEQEERDRKERERQTEIQRAAEAERARIAAEQQKQREREAAELEAKKAAEKKAEEEKLALEGKGLQEQIRQQKFRAAFEEGCDAEFGAPDRGVKPDYDRAFRAFSEARTLDPDSATVLHHLGRVQLLRGQVDSAQRYLEQAVANDQSYSWAQNDLGHLLMHHRGDLNGAEERFKRAVELAGYDPIPRLNLAKLYYARYAMDKGVEKWRRLAESFAASAIERNASCAEGAQILGHIHFGEKRFELAIAAYEKAIAMDPKFYPAHHGRGLAKAALADRNRRSSNFSQLKDEALRSLQTALDLAMAPQAGVTGDYIAQIRQDLERVRQLRQD